ncbi:MAG TPA: phage portal protein [Gemmatimonadota bacterium]|nr:phage portal protein [Gemmatimonadota bacterium]
MNLIPWRKPPAELERSDPVLSFNDWAEFVTSFSFQGINYTLPGAKQEDLDGRFPLMARSAYKSNGVVFACVLSRVQLFSEARFMFRRLRGGRPGDLFSLPSLDVLRDPWTGGTSGDLLARLMIYADIAGNAYVARRAGKLALLRPDWVTIVGGVRGDADATVWHPDADVLGYAYQEGGPALGKDPIMFLPENVAHFAPNPDPEARFRGMSWLTPVIREIMADKAATEHKLNFFENGATPNLAVKLDVQDLEVFKKWIEEFRAAHEGRGNEYKTMFLGAGADVTVVGADMKQLDFKVTQGAGETRIAAAAGVPPVVVGLSEGLQAATYSNYAQARRRFADNTIRPLWRNVCGSLARIIDVPSDAELWYDDRDISALQEDQKDAAEIMQLASTAVKTFVDAGYTPESARDAVSANDMTLLVHSGLISVQLQPPGSAAANGNGNGAVPALSETN